MDTGLAAHLCRWPDENTLANGAMNGTFFETYVISEIVKNAYNSGRQRDLYYYRDVDKREVDLLILQGDKVYPIEIKKNKLPKDPDKNLKVLSKINLEIQPELCICLSDEFVPYNRSCYLCPVTAIS